MNTQLPLNSFTQLWLAQLSKTMIELSSEKQDQESDTHMDQAHSDSNTDECASANNETANITASNQINSDNVESLLKKSASGTSAPIAKQQQSQQNALVPPTPPRTPITASSSSSSATPPKQALPIDGGSDNDDDNKSTDSENRKRKLNTLLGGSKKRMHMDLSSSMDHDDSVRTAYAHNDQDDDEEERCGGIDSRMSDYDDGKSNYSDACSIGQDSNLSKMRAHNDTNDASFDSSLSAYLQEKSGAAIPPLNLSQSLSNIVDVTGLNLAKDNYFEKPSINFLSPTAAALKMASLQGDENKLIDSGKYLSKYSSFMDCAHKQCAADKLREHFHCLDILCMNVNKVLCKREEVLRHLKWHKKRNESLTHGFLRFSSTDDCSIQFGECQHNGKQTHYHCLQGKCDKVYISTSDVQMHSNYHRKDTAIMQEGFQRYRATEECNADFCSFADQRTTHFHCIRDSCNYTFKNKAEMEKHKTYHIKDELLARDGFKKFMKSEPCSFERCRFSLQCNHIHCVRENCFYVLHSSGQLLSHKRKHERQDSEKAYQQFKIAQKNDALGGDSDDADMASLSDATGSSSKNDAQFSSLLANLVDDNKMESLLSTESLEILQQLRFQKQALLQCQAKAFANKSSDGLGDTLNSFDNNNYDPIDPAIAKTIMQNANTSLARGISPAGLEHLKQFYTESAKQKQINALLFAQNNFNDDDQSEPLNLNLKKETNDSLLSAVVQKVQPNAQGASSLHQITSIDGLFTRKRGRPPKNRVVEVYGNVQTQSRPSAIFTSFKLEKNGKSSPLQSPPDNVYQTKGSSINQLMTEECNEPKKESPSSNAFVQNLSLNLLNTSSGSSGSERKRRLSFSSSPSSETNEKVSIVRAAGTFFPRNCDDEDEQQSPSNSQRKSKDSNASKKCQLALCSQPNDSHVHCNECNETFGDNAALAAHSIKHKANASTDEPTSNQNLNASQELMQHFAKQIAKQSENLFGMDAFMNSQAAMSNIASLNQSQMPMNNDGFSFNDQISAQIQTLCLAQLASLYQHNPIMYQHLYPLLGAIEHLKQDPTQSIFLPPKLDATAATAMQMDSSLRGFDLSKMNETNKKLQSLKSQRQPKSTTGKADSKAKQMSTSTDSAANRNSSGTFKIFKDEPIPKGYLKFRFNEDCNFPNCGYSNLQSHFHCCRTDCYYSFCDKTRFVQHTARHERLDKLMGDDFKQYRANMSCGHNDCVYKNSLGANNKSSHFHCLKCDFICSDTNKVVAHRRHHSKLEYIRTAGFRKVANNERCTIRMKRSQDEDDDENVKRQDEGNEDSECMYSMKQTHFHCLVCDCCVLNRAQLSSHQHKTN